MPAKILTFLFLLCSTAYSQNTWERNWETDSLRGSVSSISVHMELFYYNNHTSSVYYSTTYAPTGQVIQEATNESLSSYCYDVAGRLSCASAPWGDTYYLHDKEGRALGYRFISDVGEGFELEKYDAQGRVVETRFKLANFNCIHIRTTFYDNEGRRIATRQFDSNNDEHCRGVAGGLSFAYNYFTPDGCIETPLAPDCSCASIAAVREDSPEDTMYTEQSCYTNDGKIRWKRNFYRHDKRYYPTYYPAIEEFVSFDEKGREIMVINKGVAFSNGKIDYPVMSVRVDDDWITYDTTKWFAVFPSYNQYDNYTGEEIYVYNTLDELRNRIGTLMHKRTITYIYDDRGNWIHQSIHEDGVLQRRETRIITYFPETPAEIKEQGEELR